MIADRRCQNRLSPPGKTGRTVQVYLSAADYRLFHELALRHGGSGAEAFRALLRQAAQLPEAQP